MFKELIETTNLIPKLIHHVWVTSTNKMTRTMPITKKKVKKTQKEWKIIFYIWMNISDISFRAPTTIIKKIGKTLGKDEESF